MLADLVDGDDVGARSQQQPVDGDLVGEREPSAGATASAELPPVTRPMTRSPGPAPAAISSSRRPPARLDSSGTGCDASRTSMCRSGTALAALDDDAAGGDAPAEQLVEHGGHADRGLAGAERRRRAGRQRDDGLRRRRPCAPSPPPSRRPQPTTAGRGRPARRPRARPSRGAPSPGRRPRAPRRRSPARRGAAPRGRDRSAPVVANGSDRAVGGAGPRSLTGSAPAGRPPAAAGGTGARVHGGGAEPLLDLRAAGCTWRCARRAPASRS